MMYFIRENPCSSVAKKLNVRFTESPYLQTKRYNYIL